MCAVKSYVDAQVMPYIQGGHKKEKKKKGKKGGEKQNTWDILK